MKGAAPVIRIDDASMIGRVSIQCKYWPAGGQAREHSCRFPLLWRSFIDTTINTTTAVVLCCTAVCHTIPLKVRRVWFYSLFSKLNVIIITRGGARLYCVHYYTECYMNNCCCL